MSRHRHIRNMNIDDEYYDDDEEEDYGNENDGGHYDDDGYDDDEYYEEEQDKAFSINDLIGEVQSVTGRILSDEQVQKILLQNSCNVERTINQIFDGPSQGSSRQSEKLTRRRDVWLALQEAQNGFSFFSQPIKVHLPKAALAFDLPKPTLASRTRSDDLLDTVEHVPGHPAPLSIESQLFGHNIPPDVFSTNNKLFDITMPSLLSDSAAPAVDTIPTADPFSLGGASSLSLATDSPLFDLSSLSSAPHLSNTMDIATLSSNPGLDGVPSLLAMESNPMDSFSLSDLTSTLNPTGLESSGFSGLDSFAMDHDGLASLSASGGASGGFGLTLGDMSIDSATTDPFMQSTIDSHMGLGALQANSLAGLAQSSSLNISDIIGTAISALPAANSSDALLSLEPVSQPALPSITSHGAFAKSSIKSRSTKLAPSKLRGQLSHHMAAPSDFASSWLAESDDPGLSPTATQHILSSILDPAPTSAPAGGASKVKPFDFSTPSPDDVVAMARKKAPAAGLQLNQGTKPAAKTVTLPSEPPSAALASMAISQPKPTPPAARTVTPKAPPAARTQPVFTPKPPSVPAQSKKNKIDVAEEYNKRKSTKDSLNLIIVGHVDAGKSTLMGHMMCLLGEVSDRALKKNQHEAEKIKKGSFSFAWVLDATEEERNRGVTIDVAEMKFETPNRQFTLLDAPGHRDFIPNMIAGACQADVAILVVDSSPGEFEAGFDLGGQTREHALLVRALGVTQLIVAVNKLDMMEWSQERYDEICKKLGAFLVHAGFKKQKLTYIPTSGWLGENLVKREEPLLNKWYKGQTLIGQLDQLEAPTRMIDRPLRMSVSDFFKGGLGTGTGGDVSVSGRIDCGSVQLKDEVLVMPINEVAVVKAIECNHESVKWAVAGDSVTISLSGIDSQHVKKGNVLCQVGHPIPITRKIRAQIVTFDISRPLTIGVPVVFHTQSLAEAGSIKSLISILDKATGEVVKKRPRALTKNLTAEVEIELLRPLCLEKSADNKFFGRFTLRCGSQTVAAGLVMDILAYENAGDVEAV